MTYKRKKFMRNQRKEKMEMKKKCFVKENFQDIRENDIRKKFMRDERKETMEKKYL